MVCDNVQVLQRRVWIDAYRPVLNVLPGSGFYYHGLYQAAVKLYLNHCGAPMTASGAALRSGVFEGRGVRSPTQIIGGYRVASL